MANTFAILILWASCSVMLLMVSWVNKLKPGVLSYKKIEPSGLGLLTYLHIMSIIIMLMPLLAIKQIPVFLLIFPDRISVVQAAAFLTLFTIIGSFPWKKFSNDFKKNENKPSPGIPHIALYVFFRSAFLVIYECFFRGLLLMSFCEWLGTEAGIAVSILLYVLMHIYKDKKEMIGCIPLGILLCAFTLWWQSIWPAIIFHFQVAIINEWPPLQRFLSPQKQAVI